jgi:hypothetical protein
MTATPGSATSSEATTAPTGTAAVKGTASAHSPTATAHATPALARSDCGKQNERE